VVRFIHHDGRYFALKEMDEPLVQREFELLSFLKDQSIPAVQLTGIATGRKGESGNDLDSVLITDHLSYSLPYLHLFASPGADGLHESLVDALVALLVRIHLVGLFWGDCSLGNALFRRDAGALAAYLVDIETGEHHETLSPGQRQLDLEIAKDNIAGGLFELEALGKLGDGIDPAMIADQLQLRYDELWSEVTRVDSIRSDELWRIRDRLHRLNQLGFDTEELELVERDGARHVSFRPAVVEVGHYRRKLAALTGIDAEENQAKRLLGAIRSFGAQLAGELDRDVPEAVVAYRWLTERYEPTTDSIPPELRDRLEPAEFFHQVLDHLWYLSEAAGFDVGLDEATADYINTVLSALPTERTVLGEFED